MAPHEEWSFDPAGCDASFRERKIWWACNKGHEWQATVNSRKSQKRGCPYCSGKAACSENCLQTINPELARQWHPRKNGSLTPADVTPYSGKMAWWICERGHEWKAVVGNRRRGRGCPYCAGRAVSENTCLQNINPSLAAEWHPEKNGRLTPRDVTPGSGRKVWWRCEKGHEWQAYMHSRSKGFGKCPYCTRRLKS